MLELIFEMTFLYVNYYKKWCKNCKTSINILKISMCIVNNNLTNDKKLQVPTNNIFLK